MLSYKKEGKDGYFFLSVSPGTRTDRNEIVKKDITFVLDVSGSMAGKKLNQAKPPSTADKKTTSADQAPENDVA